MRVVKPSRRMTFVPACFLFINAVNGLSAMTAAPAVAATPVAATPVAATPVAATPVVAAATTTNPIAAENALPGNADWAVTKPSGEDGAIQAYAGEESVNKGETVHLYVSTRIYTTYTADIYRLGYYQGKGARLIKTLPSSVSKPQGYYWPTTREGKNGLPTACPACLVNSKDSLSQDTNLTEADWDVTSSFTVPTTWTQGMYFVRLTEAATNKQWSVRFIVRDDNARADLIYQYSNNTDEAYNTWGGAGLYLARNGKTASYASFNRPYILGYGTGNLFYYEYPFIRFIEEQGYNVAYTTNNAVGSGLTHLSNYKGFVSAGHDEYWSRTERQALESAMGSGLNVAFLGGNSIYWQIRLEADGYGVRDRHIICYRYAVLDPVKGPTTTVRWRDAPVLDTESKIIKSIYGADSGYSGNQDFVVSSSQHWIYRGTNLRNGDRIKGILGYEVDTAQDPSVARVISIGSSDNVTFIGRSPFYGKMGVLESHAIISEPSSGPVAFNAGTIFWPLGLSDYPSILVHSLGQPIPQSEGLRQMTRNLFYRMITGSIPPLGGGGIPNGITNPSTQSWRAVDLAVGADNLPRLCWGRPDSAFAVWTINSSNVVSSTPSFGPFTGWNANAIGAGGDGKTRVLINSSNGQAAVWTIQSQSTGASISTPAYGPFSNLSCSDMATGADNQTRLLWIRSDGAFSVWTVSSTGDISQTPFLGPLGGWSARTISVGGDGKTRVLLNNINGQAVVWTIQIPALGTITSTPAYGPFNGLFCGDMAMGADNQPRLLWIRNDGAFSVWTVNPLGIFSSTPLFGPLGGWNAKTISVGGDGKTRVLLNSSTGQAAVWTIQNQSTGAITTTPAYGPIAAQ